jgi:hypothetical protein
MRSCLIGADVAADFGVDLTEHIQFVIDALKTIATELNPLRGAAGDGET